MKIYTIGTDYRTPKKLTFTRRSMNHKANELTELIREATKLLKQEGFKCLR